MWTALIGPVAALWGVLSGRYDFVACYVLWILATRCLRVMAAWRHGRRVSVYYIPMQLFSEWAGAIVKVWLSFHPVKQSWLHRGNRTVDATEQTSFRHVRRGLATYYCAFAVITLILLVGHYMSVLPIANELPLAIKRPTEAVAAPASTRSSTETDTGRVEVVFWGQE